MYRLRLCWNETVRMMKRVPSTSTDWVDADGEGALALRLLCKDGNDQFGQGSHWIEITHSAERPTQGRKLSPHSPVGHPRLPRPKGNRPPNNLASSGQPVPAGD